MYLTFNALQDRALYFRDHFLSSLTAQQKKIILVVAVALSGLVVLGLIWKYSFKAKEIKAPLEDEAEKVDNVPEKLSPQAEAETEVEMPHEESEIEAEEQQPQPEAKGEVEAEELQNQLEQEQEIQPAEELVKEEPPVDSHEEIAEPVAEEVQEEQKDALQEKEIPEEKKVKDEHTRNILIIGRSRSGKSTITKVLEDICQVFPSGSIFYSTKEPELHQLELSGYHLNVLDTPGLCEIAAIGKTTRTNEEIIAVIQEKVKEIFGGKGFENVDTVLMTFTVQGGINSGDITTMKAFLPILPEKIKKILVLTHSEEWNKEFRADICIQLKQHPDFSLFLTKYFKENVLFTGALAEDSFAYQIDAQMKLITIFQDRERLIEALLPTDEPEAFKTKRREETGAKAEALLAQLFPEPAEQIN